MNRYLRTLRYSPLTRGVGGLLVTLVCIVALFGCSGDSTTNNTYQSAPTSLRVTVNPASADVTVTSTVASFVTQTFTGNKVLSDLSAGQYTAKATAPGFANATGSVNVVAGVTSDIQLILQPTQIIIDAPRTVYRDENGNLIPIDTTAMQSGQFVFYAWLQDKTPGGIVPSLIMTSATVSGDPGRALVSEQTETAPSFTQNLAGAYVGFMDPSGVVRPVIGADVRWEIDQQYWGRVNSMQFGTSDDNRVALNYGVFDDQADTRTNNSHLTAERFPLIATEYPLFNMTGIGTPFADGFTWVTLFSPDAKAAGRIVAVATVNGEEIGKQILYKQFAPQPKLDITKTVDKNLVNLGTAMTGTVAWTITIHNTGTGEATLVNLRDFLASGNGANYTLGALPSGCSATGNPDEFSCVFGPLAAPGAPAPPQTAQLLGNAQSFAILANTSISNVGSSVVTGEVGISAGTSITGFPPGIILSGTTHISDAAAAAAQVSVVAAKAALDQRACLDTTGAVDISNTTILPGVHCYSSTVGLTGPVTLDAQGNPNAEFVFRIGSSLTTGAGASVLLVNGANPCNIYWQVGSSATLGAATSFVGNILAYQDITAISGASLSGRALASVGQVILGTNVVTAPLSCVAAPAQTQTLTFTSTVTGTGTYCNAAEITMYTGATSTVGLNDQVCFNAVAPELAIVKDFVADDNVTSLGKAKTVSANVPAKLRVQVINNGSGTATGVQVTDAFNAALSTGILANYTVVSSASTTNPLGGFDATIGDLVSGATATPMLFAVAASVDGVYCDTAAITAGGTGSDTACLTVATPNLTIAKTDAPTTVLPGATYTSTIVVTNNGNAPATNVVVSDLLGINTAANVQVIYVSSNQSGASGTLANNIVTANSVVSLAVNETLTFTVVSRIPLGAPSGNYCDVATVTSSNVVTKQTPTVCVFVPAFSALQTQLTDFGDPVLVGGDVSYFSTLYVEALSNQGVHNNVLTYLFGHVATDLVTPGVFDVTSTKVYVDTAPIRDPITGVVVSDTTNPTAVLQTLGTDYTLSAPQIGRQVITMTPATILQPNTAIYVVNVVHIPAGTTAGMKTTSYIWDSDGPTTHYQASSSEPTTVLP